MRIASVLLLTICVLVCSQSCAARRTSPMVIGHRGSSATAPENTLIAFAETFKDGGDGFETDLRTSSDGHIVLIHDSTVDRTTNCTTLNLPGQCRCGLVNDLTLAELKSCDAGSWFGPEFAGAKIPTMSEAVELAKAFNGVIVMDLKEDDQSQGLLGAELEPILTSNEYETLSIASCWTAAQVENMDTYLKSAVKQKLGDVPSPTSNQFFADVISAGAHGFSASLDTTTNDFIYEAHLRLMPVYVWSVNDEDGMYYSFSIGVDGIITDYPGTCAQVVDGLLEGCRTSNPIVSAQLY